MPDYYLIPDEERAGHDDSAFYDNSKYIYNKPLPQNLLLPSIHASRHDNFLLVENEGKEAVDALISSCSDANCWPSYRSSTDSESVFDCATTKLKHPNESERVGWNRRDDSDDLQVEGLLDRSKDYAFTKQKPPFLTYGDVEPHVINAARDLFFEKKRQQILYGAASTWGRTPSMPSDYELFTFWASLPKSEKMKYIAEVNGAFSGASIPTNYLETQRAVMYLYTSCPGSHSWPSFQFTQSPAYASQPLHPYAFK